MLDDQNWKLKNHQEPYQEGVFGSFMILNIRCFVTNFSFKR